MAAPDREAKLAALQLRQHNLFTADQAIACDFTPAAIRAGVRRGRWRRVLKTVLADASAPPTSVQEALGACLACGHESSAVASHGSALAVWASEIALPGIPEVTVPFNRHPALAGVKVHRTRRLGRSDRTRVGVIPVTTAMRTLTDVAGRLSQPDLARVLDDFRRRNLVQAERLVAFLDEPWSRNQPASDVLRALSRSRIGTAPTATGLETDFLEIVRAARLPVPISQFPIWTPERMRYADFAYEDERIAIELDGFEWRSDNPREFENWHVRQNAIEQQGWRFRRFTSVQVLREPLFVVYTLAAALDLWPTRWSDRRRGPALPTSHRTR